MAWSIIAFCLLANAPVALAVETSTYNPTACKENAHGKIFIALAHTVLALPATTPVVVETQIDAKDRIPPPDPSDPLGCFGNPLQLGGYALPYANARSLTGEEKTAPNQELGTQMVQLIRLYPDGGQIWPGEDLNLMKLRTFCTDPTVHTELKSGLSACLFQPFLGKDATKPVADQRDWGGVYYSTVYKTPLGRPFVIFCYALLYSERGPYCYVSYAVTPYLGLTYKFKPYHGTKIIPIDRVIDFDKQLRRVLDQITMKNYSWPVR